MMRAVAIAFLLCCVAAVYLYEQYNASSFVANTAGGATTVAATTESRKHAKHGKPSSYGKAILHFGNRKTASTSIQDTLVHASDILEKDGFVYFGHRQRYYIHGPGKYLRECVVNGLDPCPDEYQEAWGHFEQYVKGNLTRGVSVVYSDEDIPRLTAVNPKALDTVDSLFANFETHVKVTYRHYTDWLLSEYNQEQKKRINRLIVGFVDWHRGADEKKEVLLEPLTKAHLEEYSRRFDSVSVFNMHEISSPYGLVVDWLCTMLPEANTTCQKAQSNDLPAMPRDNPSDDDLDARRLTQLYISDGGADLRRLKKSDKNVVQQMAKQVKAWLNSHSAGDIPMICLTEEEKDELWTMTVRTRDELVPGYDISNSILRERFNKSLPKFCQIDYMSLVSQDNPLYLEWKALVVEMSKYNL